MATLSEALNLALQLHQAGRLPEAEQRYRRILQADPHQAEAWNLLGVLAGQMGKPDESLECLRRAVTLQPLEASYHSNLGLVLQSIDLREDALRCFQEALRLKPEFAEACYNLGLWLAAEGKWLEAEAQYREALRLSPASVDACNDLGDVLRQLGRLDEAGASYEQGLKLRESPEGHTTLGLTRFDQGRFDEALEHYAEALRLCPHHPDARANRALVYLLRGDLERGWPEYEWRWRVKSAPLRHLPRPHWDGSSLAGRTILLHHEQGIGDTLQFVRYASLLKAMGATVLFEAPAELLPLLARCQGIDRFLAYDSQLPAFDVHAPLMSLPALLRTNFDSIPAKVPYLSAEPTLIEHWQHELHSIRNPNSAFRNPLRVGIAWQGNPAHRTDRWRSIPLASFEPLTRVPGVQLFSLQRGHGVEQLHPLRERFVITDLADRLDHDSGMLMDTAAVMTNLDLVVSCDTAIPHLAGALGIPVWTVLGLVPDWRWLLDREDSPWYPTMRLFRQRQCGEWVPVFERIAEELREAVRMKSGSTCE